MLSDVVKKYGKARTKQATINRAIRAEIVGGDDCLDALEKLHRLTYRLRERNLRGIDDAQVALDACRRVADGMSDVIYERYQIGGK